MQAERFQVRGLSHLTKACSGREWHGTGARQNFWRIIEEHFVSRSRSQCCPVHHRATFNHNAGDFPVRETTADRLEIRPTIRTRRSDLLDQYALLLELLLSLFLGKRAEHQDVLFCSLDDARLARQTQMRVNDNAQERAAARK